MVLLLALVAAVLTLVPVTTAAAAAPTAGNLPNWHVVALDTSDASEPALRLAARDAVRYLRLLRCGVGAAAAACESAVSLRVVPQLDVVPLAAAAATVVVSTLARVPARLLLPDLTLGDDAHAVYTAPPHLRVGDGPVTVCTGATPRAALYAVYMLLESLGARFTLSGDALPAANASLELPLAGRPLRAAPRFAQRGLQPFHDFPMGPDWWTADFFKATATQMAKLRMNFWGFHTYPFLSAGPEPAVWVGAAGGFDAASGNVTEAGAYPTSWYLTMDFPRGNLPGSISRATSDYCCGAGAVFPRDCYGSDAQAAECWPGTPAASARVLNDAAAALQDAFAWAAAAGVESCLGAEVPLTKPPGSNATLRELYEGLFARVAAATPAVTCFWLWTTEDVEDHATGKGLPQSDPLWARLAAEIAVALAARDAVAPHLAVGTNGWCLGPGDNSSYFDAVVPDPRFSLASIDGCLGWCDVDDGYARVTRHASTVIPWMEDDLGLAGAELWVARTLQHARDAARLGARGLLGILWRTWETAPQVAALAAAGWDGAENATALGVYADFCAGQFGAATAAACARLLLALDGATADGVFDPTTARLPRGGQGCCGGPLYPGGGGGEGAPAFVNTTALEAWAATVTGAANAERAARWVGLFTYHNALAQASAAGAALQAAAARVHDAATAREFGFPALAALSWAWEALVTSLLAVALTPGELGMLAAHEGMNWPARFLAAAGPILPYLAACAPADAPESSCFVDNYTVTGRVLPYTVTLNDPACSREWCARECVAAGFPLAGVEFGVACFCGHALPPNGSLPNAACGAMPCAGAPGERCGDADVVSVFPAACPPTPGLPPDLLPPRAFRGAPRMWQTVVRTTAAAAERALRVEVAVLHPDGPPGAVRLTWWTVPGPSANATLALAPVAAGRALWAAGVPLPADTAVVLAYIVEATWGGGGEGATLTVPVEGAQTVAIV